MKKKVALVLALVCCFAEPSFADMALPISRTFTQTDGTKVSVVLRGDENFSYFENASGEMFLRDHTSQSQIKKATYLEKTASVELWQKRLCNRNISYVERSRKLRYSAKYSALTGQKRALVILTQFSDVKFQTANDNAAFTKQFNEVGYTTNGNVGSVHDYFYAQSNGKFDLTFDVVGPVTLANTMAYYGAYDIKNDRSDIRPAAMVGESVDAAEAAGIDFSQYDWDGDGKVENVFVVFADKSESESANENNLWAHKYTLYGGFFNYGDGTGKRTYDGVEIDTYACAGELNYMGKMAGVGTPCHEFSHSLGLRDMYDVTYSGCYGMQSWDIMHNGNHNDDGYAPAAYTSFERMQIGWESPQELSTPANITSLPAITDNPSSYIVRNSGNANEYYLLENRQQKSWDKGLKGHGLLVIHVDYDAAVWAAGAINAEATHQRCSPIAADNSYTSSDVAGDTYPGTSNNTSLTNTSIPAATLFNKNSNGSLLMCKSITDIAEKDGIISFVFMGALGQPTPLPATNITAQGFTANWTAADNAETYHLEIREQKKGATSTKTVLSEDFSKCNDSGEVSGSLDSYMQQTGWTGSELRVGSKKMVLGPALSTGTLTSPIIAAPNEGNVWIHFTEESYVLSGYSTTIQLLSSDGKTSYGSQTINTEGKSHTVAFTQVADAFKVQITGKYTALTAFSIVVTDESVKTTLIENLTATSYTYTSAQDGCEYAYRVKALNKEAATEWSDYQRVVPSLLTGRYYRLHNAGKTDRYMTFAEDGLWGYEKDENHAGQIISIIASATTDKYYLQALSGRYAQTISTIYQQVLTTEDNSQAGDFYILSGSGNVKSGDATTEGTFCFDPRYSSAKKQSDGGRAIYYNENASYNHALTTWAPLRDANNYEHPQSFWAIEDVDFYSITMASSGYSTLYLSYPVFIPAGVNAYYATEVSSTQVKMTRITSGIIAAHVGVVLKGNAGETYDFVKAGEGTSPSVNYLKGSTEPLDMTGFTRCYTLQGGAFYKVSGGTLPANKAYLEIPEELGVASLTIDFDDSPTSIFSLDADPSSPSFDSAQGRHLYNLKGQRVNKMQKGIFIVNGKKLLYE